LSSAVTSTQRLIVTLTRLALPSSLDEIRLKLDVLERTWIEVTIDGDVVFSGNARVNDTFEWTAQQEAKVSAGNAIGVFVTINDIELGRLGGRGEQHEEIWRTTQLGPGHNPTATITPLSQTNQSRVNVLPGGLEVIQVFIPAGSFLMGSAESDRLASNDEFPQHEVSLDAFWIDQTEVTNAQFATFLNEEGNQGEGGVEWLEEESSYVLIESRDGVYQPKAGFEAHPVIEVSWYGARAYCEWTGGRLPTEAEWEYAARGPDSRIYPWGNQAPTCNLANYGNCVGATTELGSYVDKASWVGAFDMSGNVWEWVNDWYDSGYYENALSENPTGPQTSQFRVRRGGAWYNQYVRAASRFNYEPGYRSYVVGFRCAQE
jgi:formylglycine-generating enzyme required for sulfatase activity